MMYQQNKQAVREESLWMWPLMALGWLWHFRIARAAAALLVCFWVISRYDRPITPEPPEIGQDRQRLIAQAFAVEGPREALRILAELSAKADRFVPDPEANRRAKAQIEAIQIHCRRQLKEPTAEHQWRERYEESLRNLNVDLSPPEPKDRRSLLPAIFIVVVLILLLK